jgi:hypothetical protein
MYNIEILLSGLVVNSSPRRNVATSWVLSMVVRRMSRSEEVERADRLESLPDLVVVFLRS